MHVFPTIRSLVLEEGVKKDRNCQTKILTLRNEKEYREEDSFHCVCPNEVFNNFISTYDYSM